jgi:D-alanyl-lipoteichoic acid acyltransferase DltB (MBOAT superfamily)
VDLISLRAALFVGAAVVLVAVPWPGPGRRLLLLAANLAFLWAFDPLAPAIFVAVSLLGWFAARRAAAGASVGELILLGAPLLLPLFLPKLPWLGGGGAAADAEAAGASGVSNVVGARMAMFIGASYFTLRALHVVLDARRHRRVHLGLFDFLVYNSFFPMTVAGPIERADHFALSYERLGRATREDWAAGLTRIFQGLLKKVVLGGIALAWAAPITGFGSGPFSASSSGQAWLALYAITLYAYFDFAGYSDMSIGVARLMGLRLAENFDNPYLRPSIAEFWRGWHLSLSFWIRDYLFLPMCGRTASALRPHAAALGSMTLCGLWHAPNPGWVLWGLLHGAGLSVHQAWTVWLRKRFALKKRLAASIPVRVVATALTFHFVALTWVFVAIDPWRLAPSVRYLGVLFGLN